MLGATFASPKAVVANDKPKPPEHIRALLDEADRVCAQAEVETRRLEKALQQPPFWPERRRPRRWSAAEYGRDVQRTPDQEG